MDSLLNLTPHAVTVLLDGRPVVVPPTHPPARCQEALTPAGVIDTEAGRFPLLESSFGAVEDLPEPAPGVWYVVSRFVAEAVPLRRDVVVPARVDRDERGQVVSCRGFARVRPPAAPEESEEA